MERKKKRRKEEGSIKNDKEDEERKKGKRRGRNEEEEGELNFQPAAISAQLHSFPFPTPHLLRPWLPFQKCPTVHI